jgi:hypothetical protein
MSRAHLFPRPIDQEKHMGFLKNRVQSRFRKETWELTIEEYFSLWPDDLWVQRGRLGHELVLTRRDVDGAWSVSNCVICTRLAVIQQTNAKNRGVKRKPYKPRKYKDVS